jgi:hypothetical protein
VPTVSLALTPLRRLGRILSFRFDHEDIATLGWRDLALGLTLVWLAGMGRYWDNPRALELQRWGIGSLVYVVLLSTLLFLLGAPLAIERWSLRRVTTFVALTAPPAFLYAIPVERWLGEDTARGANIVFLAVVALWRVVLYAVFLGRFARLALAECAILLFLPLCAIVASLAALNLERAVFDVMGGLTETTAADGAYFVLMVLSLFATGASPFLLIGYAAMVWRSVRTRRDRRAAR